MRSPLALLPLLAVPVIAANVAMLMHPAGETGLETRERAMALVNAGQQISAAQAIYRLQSGDSATEIRQLVDRGDLQVPAFGSENDAARLGSWKTDGRMAYVSLDGDVSALCAELSRQASGSRSGAKAGVGRGGDQFGCEQGGGQSRFVFRTW